MREALSIHDQMALVSPDVTVKTVLTANTFNNSDSVNILRVFFVCFLLSIDGAGNFEIYITNTYFLQII